MDRKPLKVCEKRCNECLFSKNRLVLEQDAERIVADCLEQDRYFICHKFSSPLKPDGNPVCCRGFYDRHKLDVLPTRLAAMFNFVEFVDVPTEKLD